MGNPLEKENKTKLFPLRPKEGVYLARNVHYEGRKAGDMNITLVRKVKPHIVETSFGPVTKTLEKMAPEKFEMWQEAQSAFYELSKPRG